MKHLVWIKENGRWETTGEGPFSKPTADRIAAELRRMFGLPVRVMPADQSPIK